MINENPEIFKKTIQKSKITVKNGKIELTENNIFELVRDIIDPEHPHTLEELGIVDTDNIRIYELETGTNEIDSVGLPIKIVEIKFTPTVPHCSMAGIIGLAIRYVTKDLDCYVRIEVVENTHVNWKTINKQLDDFDRVLAALENEQMIELLSSLTKNVVLIE